MATQTEETAREDAALKKKDEGNVAFKEHRYNKAIQLYTESLRLVPNHLVFGNRAQSYIHIEQYELALRDLNEALRMVPSFVKNISRRAKVLSLLGMNSTALLDIESISLLSPKDKNAKKEREVLKIKANRRYKEVKQWDGGVEFEEDEMISIPIGGCEPPMTAVAPATVPKAMISIPIGGLEPPMTAVAPATVPKAMVTVAPVPRAETTVLPTSPAQEHPSVCDNYSLSTPVLHSKEEESIIKKEVKMEDEENTVPETSKPTALPPPAKNIFEFQTHFHQLTHDSEAFGKYFLSIAPFSLLSIFSNLLDEDHVKAIVQGLTLVANQELADLSSISSSLLALSFLPRFDILVMFMNDDDRAKAFSLIDLLPSNEESKQIRQNFQ